MDIRLEISFTDEEHERFMRPVSGQGGFQSLIRRLQRAMHDNVVILTTVEDIRNVVEYWRKYGKGGFQTRLAPAARKITRTSA